MNTKRIVTIVAVLIATAALITAGVFVFHPEPGCGEKPDPEPASADETGAAP